MKSQTGALDVLGRIDPDLDVPPVNIPEHDLDGDIPMAEDKFLAFPASEDEHAYPSRYAVKSVYRGDRAVFPSCLQNTTLPNRCGRIYEWKSTEHGKQRCHLFLKDHASFAFAGLWEHGDREGYEPTASCTTIVTEANRTVEKIHERMPVILPPDAYDEWLNPEVTEKDRLQKQLSPCSATKTDIHPISRLVNNVRNNDPRCVERIV